ncbi:DUF397 domain-containing protein [Phytomonospora sp. NPDC050363]|uniref:DUF397 domain-containing protein n=1 Tax=Phytomonospora sp. NPDC050363 TaxID=3155642 RepID=UPI00340E1C7E
MRWVKSSRSSNNGACVEVAEHAAEVLVRDSKITGHDYPTLSLPAAAWTSFLTEVRTGRLDS